MDDILKIPFIHKREVPGAVFSRAAARPGRIHDGGARAPLTTLQPARRPDESQQQKRYFTPVFCERVVLHRYSGPILVLQPNWSKRDYVIVNLVLEKIYDGYPRCATVLLFASTAFFGSKSIRVFYGHVTSYATGPPAAARLC
ncbi:hypothetical protein EVAR_51000_1 [Eumeta japonica]|uniref:Uncharacterized protein n=1 Tax=Eumeta variegata TaxID=151549 RepID=A0A4C1ZYU7_EUMVA|nr:hypothetical protein EVAR_51000_1 [Eumeta japonica]